MLMFRGGKRRSASLPFLHGTRTAQLRFSVSECICVFVYPPPPVFSVSHWTAFDSTRTIESITEEVNKQRRVRIIFCRTEEKLRGAVYARGSKAPATCYSAIFSLICLLFFFFFLSFARLPCLPSPWEEKKPFRGSKDNRNVKKAILLSAYLGNCSAFRIGLRK